MKIACGEVGRQQELVLLDETLGGESHTAAGLTRGTNYSLALGSKVKTY